MIMRITATVIARGAKDLYRQALGMQGLGEFGDMLFHASGTLQFQRCTNSYFHRFTADLSDFLRVPRHILLKRIEPIRSVSRTIEIEENSC